MSVFLEDAIDGEMEDAGVQRGSNEIWGDLVDSLDMDDGFEKYILRSMEDSVVKVSLSLFKNRGNRNHWICIATNPDADLKVTVYRILSDANRKGTDGGISLEWISKM